MRIRHTFGCIEAAVLAYIGCALLLSCQDPGPNQSSPPTEEMDPLRLERERIIGEQTGAVFGRIRDMAVDSDGRIYVSDPTLNAIQVFSPSGERENTIGREGRGPGEFENLGFIAVGKNDTLYAFDGPERLSVYPPGNKMPAYEIAIPKSPLGGPVEIFPADTTGFLVEYEPGVFTAITRPELERSDWLTWIDHHGRILRDSIRRIPSKGVITRPHPEFEGPYGTAMSTIFHAESHFRVGPDNSIYGARTDSLIITRFDWSGTRAERFQWPVATAPITGEDVDSLASTLRRPRARDAVRNQELPERWPVVEQFVVGAGGRLWIDPNDKPGGLSRPIVVDPRSGEQFTFDLPENVTISAVKHGRLYGVRKQRSGVEEVVVYQFPRDEL